MVQEQLQGEHSDQENMLQCKDRSHSRSVWVFVMLEPWEQVVDLLGAVAAHDDVWEDREEAEDEEQVGPRADVMSFSWNRSLQVLLQFKNITSTLNQNEDENEWGRENKAAAEHSQVAERGDHLDVVVEYLVVFFLQLLELLQ